MHTKFYYFHYQSMTWEEDHFLMFVIFLELKSNSELSQRLGKVNGIDFGLQHFSYDNSILVEDIFKRLSRTNFTGLTVRTYIKLKSVKYLFIF